MRDMFSNIISEQNLPIIKENLKITNLCAEGSNTAISPVKFEDLSPETMKKIADICKDKIDASVVVFAWTKRSVEQEVYITEGDNPIYNWSYGFDVNDELILKMADHIENVRQDILNRLYESYKLDWILKHGYTLQDFAHLMADADDMLRSEDRYPEGNAWNIFDSIAKEIDPECFSFDRGGIWKPMGEFQSNELKDTDYVLKLLGYNKIENVDMNWNECMLVL